MARLAVAFLLAMALAPHAWSQGLDKAAWREVLSGIESDLDRRAAEVADVRRELPALAAEARQSLSLADNQLTQALILRGVAGSSPWALRTLLVHYQSVGSYLDHGSQKLRLAKEHLERVKDENATLRDIRRRGPDVEYNNATVGAIEGPSRKMEAIKNEVDSLKQEIDATLSQFDGLAKNVDEARKELREDYIDVFKEHFFRPSRPPMDGYGLVLLRSRAADWTVDFPRFIVPVAAWTDWAGLLTAGIPLWAALWGLGRLAARRTGAWEQERVRRGWPLLALGLAFYVTTYVVSFTGSHFFNLLLVVAAAWGAVILTRQTMEPGALDFFLALYGAGTALQFLNFPAELICVTWPAVMALAAWNRWRAERRRAAYGLAVMGLVALAGYGPQSVMLVQAWFLLRLTIAGSRTIRAAMERKGGVWIQYVHPFAVTLMAVAYVSWVLLFMGGPGFVDYVYALEWKMGPVKVSLDAAAVMAVLFFAARLILAWLDAFMERASYGGKPLDPALAHTLSTVASYVTWVAWLLAALTSLGMPLSGLTWIASGLSVGVGFGLKDIINNFVSGLIILFGGSIKKGDVVQTGKTLGEVTNVSVRNTTVRTLDNSMVIIPNSSFLRGEIINWSYQDKRIRLTIHVSVAPGTKVKKVRKLLLSAAKEHGLVLKEPAPSVVLRQFGRYGLDFEMYVWIEDFRDKFKVESDLASSIDQILQENKVTVAFQGIKVKYKPKGTEEAQREAAREALKEKRRKVFSLVRRLRGVHQRARWKTSAPGGGASSASE